MTVEEQTYSIEGLHVPDNGDGIHVCTVCFETPGDAERFYKGVCLDHEVAFMGSPEDDSVYIELNVDGPNHARLYVDVSVNRYCTGIDYSW